MKPARFLAGAAAAMMAALATLTGVGAAAAAPSCSIRNSGVAIPARTPGLSWAENVAYDGFGDLWVSRTLSNVVERYDRSGQVTASLPVQAPGAVRPGPHGRMYVAAGDTPLNIVPGLPRHGQIMWFDPAAISPRPHVFATGLAMPNGLAFDARGDLYVADSNLGVVRIDRDGRIDQRWTSHAPKNLAPNATVNGNGMNGIVISGETALVTMTTSLTGRVLRVPLRDPANVGVAVDLTTPMPGVLDDLALLDSHTIAVASTVGTITVADLRTSMRCSANLGEPLTSVAVDPRDSHDLVLGTESGNIRRARVSFSR